MYITPTNIIPTLLVCFVAWRVVRRVRRSVGRQPIQPKRMTMRIIIFSVVTLALAMLSSHETRFMLALGGGLAAGVMVGLLGLRLTRFENTIEGRFYIPNTYVGMAVSFLLLARLAYRMTLLYAYTQPAANGPPGLMQSPLTLFLFGLAAGYYIAYYIGIFICFERMKPAETNG